MTELPLDNDVFSFGCPLLRRSCHPRQEPVVVGGNPDSSIEVVIRTLGPRTKEGVVVLDGGEDCHYPSADEATPCGPRLLTIHVSVSSEGPTCDSGVPTRDGVSSASSLHSHSGVHEAKRIVDGSGRPGPSHSATS